MDDASLAMAAEQTFLKHYGSLESLSWGWRALWRSGDDWPKFNFLQLKTGLASAEIKDILANEQRRWPKDRTFSVRTESPKILGAKWIEAGSAIVSYLMSPELVLDEHMNDTHFKTTIALHETRAEREHWVVANTDGRSWPRGDLIYAPLRRLENDHLKLWSLQLDTKEIVATIATEEFSHGHNRTFLSVRPRWRRQGYMRDFFFKLRGHVNGPWFAQVNEGEAPDDFLKQLPACRRLLVSRRFVLGPQHT